MFCVVERNRHHNPKVIYIGSESDCELYKDRKLKNARYLNRAETNLYILSEEQAKEKGIKMGTKYTEAQAKATLKYLEGFDEIKIRVPKGTKSEWKSKAEEDGKSLNQFIIEKVSGSN